MIPGPHLENIQHIWWSTPFPLATLWVCTEQRRFPISSQPVAPLCWRHNFKQDACACSAFPSTLFSWITPLFWSPPLESTQNPFSIGHVPGWGVEKFAKQDRKNLWEFWKQNCLVFSIKQFDFSRTSPNTNFTLSFGASRFSHTILVNLIDIDNYGSGIFFKR